MVKKWLLAMLAVCVLCCLVSCGKNEAEDAEAPDSAAEDASATPEVVPGEMVLIPAGEFVMGSNLKYKNGKEDPSGKYSNAYPEHKVKLPDYLIDKYEITNEEFMTFSSEKGYAGEAAEEGKDWRLFATLERMNVPVVYITWKDAEEYCKAQGKRLPTEEEWEKAARGPEGLRYPWGNEWEDGRAMTNEAGREATDIGKYDDVSPYGVHDMLGNVQEWTGSWYETYKGGNPDPKAGKTLRVVRGLSPNFRGKQGNLWNRDAQLPTVLYNFGSRCAADATPENIAKFGVKK